MKIDVIVSNFTSNCYLIHVNGYVYIVDPAVNVNIICSEKTVSYKYRLPSALPNYSAMEENWWLGGPSAAFYDLEERGGYWA